MSTGGPPPPTTTIAGFPPFILWNGIAGAANFSATLQQMNTQWSAPQTRWTAICMLRLVRLALNGVEPDFIQLKKLPYSFRQVYRVGRLSEVAVQTGVADIAANPLHIDIDWFGDGPALDNWWNVPAGVGFGHQAEVLATQMLLHFLEASMNLAPSGLHPVGAAPSSTAVVLLSRYNRPPWAVTVGRQPWKLPIQWGWSWPAGAAPNNNNWGNMANIAAPPAKARFGSLQFEWHQGKTPLQFSCSSTGNVFAFETPNTNRASDF